MKKTLSRLGVISLALLLAAPTVAAAQPEELEKSLTQEEAVDNYSDNFNPSGNEINSLSAIAAAPLSVKIVPVFVDSGEGVKHTQKQLVDAYNFSSNHWVKETAGRVKFTMAKARTVKTKVNFATSDWKSVAEGLNKELGLKPFDEKGTIVIYFVNSSKLQGSQSASSYNNRQGHNGLIASGGAMLVKYKTDKENTSGLIAHEIGHSFSIGHANAVFCTDGTIDPTVATINGATPTYKEKCEVQEYQDYLDVMGNVYGSGALNSATASTRGIAVKGEVKTITPSNSWTSYTLKPWGTRNGTQKAIKIAGSRVSEDTYIELRTNTGMDANQAVNGKQGVRFLHPGNDSAYSSQSVLIPSPTSAGNYQPWQKGQIFINSKKTYAVKITDVSSGSATIQVKKISATEAKDLAYKGSYNITANYTKSAYYRGETPTLNVTVKNTSGKVVSGVKVEQWRGNVLYRTVATNSKGVATFMHGNAMNPGTWNYQYRVSSNNAKNFNRNVKIQLNNPSIAISRNTSGTTVKLNGSRNATAKATIKVNNKTVKTVSGSELAKGVKLSLSQANFGTNVQVTFPGDAYNNKASKTFKDEARVSPSVSIAERSSDMATIVKVSSKKALTGKVSILVNNKAVKTLTATQAKNYTLPFSQAKAGVTVTVKYSGDNSNNSFNKSLKKKAYAYKLSSKWTKGTYVRGVETPKLVATVKTSAGSVAKNTKVQLYANGKYVSTHTTNSKGQVSINRSKTMGAGKYTYNLIVPGNKSASTKTPTMTVAKSTPAVSVSKDKKGFTVKLSAKYSASGNVNVKIGNKTYSFKAGKSVSKKYSYNSAIKKGAKVAVSYAGDGYNNKTSKSFTV